MHARYHEVVHQPVFFLLPCRVAVLHTLVLERERTARGAFLSSMLTTVALIHTLCGRREGRVTDACTEEACKIAAHSVPSPCLWKCCWVIRQELCLAITLCSLQ